MYLLYIVPTIDRTGSLCLGLLALLAVEQGVTLPKLPVGPASTSSGAKNTKIIRNEYAMVKSKMAPNLV